MIVQYEFPNKAKDIPPTEKSIAYRSIKEDLKRKLDEGKTPKCATLEVLKEKGGIEKITYGAEVPTINQAYDISRKRSKSSQDPFKTLIDKQQKDGYIYREYKQILFHTTSFYSMNTLSTILRIFVVQIILAINPQRLGILRLTWEESSILCVSFNI